MLKDGIPHIKIFNDYFDKTELHPSPDHDRDYADDEWHTIRFCVNHEKHKLLYLDGKLVATHKNN